MISALSFVGGLVIGIIFTLSWTKLSKSNKSKYRGDDDEIECDYIPESNLGSNKLVLAVRNDLKMGKGKVAAQCSHAAVLAHELCRKNCPYIFADWKRNGQPKIVVKIDSEQEMLKLAKEAKKYEILVSIVQDAGRTQVASGSRTVLAVGPGPEGLIDQVTGHLKLFMIGLPGLIKTLRNALSPNKFRKNLNKTLTFHKVFVLPHNAQEVVHALRSGLLTKTVTLNEWQIGSIV